jgi:hypothetical protein
MSEPQTPVTNPYDVIRLACSKCGHEVRYRRERIIAQYGKNAAMTDVLRHLAGCNRWSAASGPCGAHFLDLDNDAVLRDADAYMNEHARTFRQLHDA